MPMIGEPPLPDQTYMLRYVPEAILISLINSAAVLLVPLQRRRTRLANLPPEFFLLLTAPMFGCLLLTMILQIPCVGISSTAPVGGFGGLWKQLQKPGLF